MLRGWSSLYDECLSLRFFRRGRGDADILLEGLPELIGVPNDLPLRVCIPPIGCGGVR